MSWLGYFDGFIALISPVLVLIILLGLFTVLFSYQLKRHKEKASLVRFIGNIVLSAIVIILLFTIYLASLNSARSKSINAAVRSTMNNMRAQSELYYDDNNSSYLGVCESIEFQDMANLVKRSVPKKKGLFCPLREGEVVCRNNETEYVVYARLYDYYNKIDKAKEYYCIDNNGNAKTLDTAPEGMACE